MKYWFFNGEDVIGPLAPQELASRRDFLATSLICPENASEQAESWQFASHFAEFHFDETSSRVALVASPEAASSSPTGRKPHARRRAKKPAKPVAAEFIRLSRGAQETVGPASVALAKENSVDLILPQETPAASAQPAQQTAPDVPVSPAVKKVIPPEGGAISSCVLPVVPEQISEEKLPLLPEGDVSYTPPAEPDFAVEEDIPLPQEQAVKTPAALQDTTEKDVLPPEQENLSAQPDPVEPTVSQVKARLIPTPEIEEFLTDHSLPFLARRKRKSQWALLFLVALLLPGIMALLMQTGCISFKTVPAAQQVALPLSEERVAELTQQTPAAATPVAAPAVASGESKALAAVQNYTLSGNRGTISSYFAKLYQERLQHGYTAVWSAELLHNNTYIVKYRIAKTRAEPVVYVFQADIKKNQLTGALNNAALDLVGKI